MRKIHSQARTTPQVRAKIQASSLSVDALAKQHNLIKATARKWKSGTNTQDRSHTLHTTLTPAQEAIVAELHRLLLLPLDERCKAVIHFDPTQKKITPNTLNRIIPLHINQRFELKLIELTFRLTRIKACLFVVQNSRAS